MSRTVEDAGPYKERLNFLMRTCALRWAFFFCNVYKISLFF